MSDPYTAEDDRARSATAVATPPAPPARPPATGVGTEPPGGGKRGNRKGVWIAVTLVAIALLLIGGVVWLVMWSIGGRASSTVSSAAVQSAFASAMKKGGVSASYPTTAPVELTTVIATGSHPFSATFTPEEVGALANTFSYTASVAGMQISLSQVVVAFPAAGTAKLDAQVAANGGAYNGSVTAPVTYSMGQVRSPGATDLTVEGIGANSAQKAQVTDALVLYANSLLSAAPGLKVTSADIQADGLHVSGTAPDKLSYP